MVDFSDRVPLVSNITDTFSEMSGIGGGDKLTPKSVKTTIDLTLPKGLPDKEALSSMPFDKIEELREKYKGNTRVQDYLGPSGARSLNREVIGENLAMLLPLTVATVGYPTLKAVGVLPEDTKTSSSNIEQIKQGFIGIGEGLKSYFTTQEETSSRISTGKIKYPAEERQNKIRSQVESLVDKLIQTESSGRHTNSSGELTTSEAGAKGITQVLPKTGVDPGYGIKPLQNETKEEYIRFGKDYLHKMIDIFDDVEKGVAAYNAGPGAIHRAISKEKRTGKNWKEFLPKETKEYIKKVSIDNETIA